RPLAPCNAACPAIAGTAFERRSAHEMERHQPVDYDIRERFGRWAQMGIRAIAKAAEASKRDREQRPSCRAHGAMPDDERIMNVPRPDRGSPRVESAALSTRDGRIVVPFRCGAYQEARLDRIGGQADRLDRTGTVARPCAVDAPAPAPGEASAYQ